MGPAPSILPWQVRETWTGLAQGRKETNGRKQVVSICTRVRISMLIKTKGGRGRWATGREEFGEEN